MVQARCRLDSFVQKFGRPASFAESDFMSSNGLRDGLALLQQPVKSCRSSRTFTNCGEFFPAVRSLERGRIVHASLGRERILAARDLKARTGAQVAVEALAVVSDLLHDVVSGVRTTDTDLGS